MQNNVDSGERSATLKHSAVSPFITKHFKLANGPKKDLPPFLESYAKTRRIIYTQAAIHFLIEDIADTENHQENGVDILERVQRLLDGARRSKKRDRHLVSARSLASAVRQLESARRP